LAPQALFAPFDLAPLFSKPSNCVVRPAPFLFLSANTPWVYALAEALAHDAPAHAVRLYDWRTYWQNRPTWPDANEDADLERTLRVLPTGYAGRLERIARPFLRFMIDGWRDDLREAAGQEPYVVAPYPYLAPWLSNVPESRLLYYNLDAYTLYRPERKDQIRQQEATLIRRSARTLCLAQTQVDALCERHPDEADRIRHFPLGVVEQFLNPRPDEPPVADTVTYVGNMTNRVDWPFVDAVVARCPDLTFRFVGSVDARSEDAGEGDWRSARARVMDRPNVDAVGRVPQSEVTSYYWTSSVNWIPYDPEHPFNAASCPTKIMDSLASGRPVASTSVPECTLYRQWIDVDDDPDAMASLLQDRAARHDPERAEHQVRWTRQHTWPHRADTLRSMLHSSEPVTGHPA